MVTALYCFPSWVNLVPSPLARACLKASPKVTPDASDALGFFPKDVANAVTPIAGTANLATFFAIFFALEDLEAAVAAVAPVAALAALCDLRLCAAGVLVSGVGGDLGFAYLYALGFLGGGY